jgi:glycosyltransferase involved in cell wall biosynthesis
MNILWITDWPPDAEVGGAQSIYHHLMRRVMRSHSIYLATFVRSPRDRQRAAALGSLCRRVDTVDHSRGPRGLRGALSAPASGQPFWNQTFWSRTMAETIRRLCETHPIDIVQIEHAHMAPYVRWLPPGRPLWRILVLHNIGPIFFWRMWRIERRLRRKVQYLVDCLLSLAWERAIASRFDACVTLSAHDRRRLLALAPQLDCHVVRHGIDVESLQPLPLEPASRELVMVGNMAYPPNRDGARFFCDRVLPHIRAAVPDARLTVVGQDPPAALTDRMPPGLITLTGFVDSVVPHYRSAAVAVVPLRAGSGVRGKILEAMALGRPVVSTSIGCEGLDVAHGKHILIADSPSDFAGCVARLLREPRLCQQLAEGGRQYVEGQHSWDASAGSLLRLYDALAERGR